MYLQFPSSQQQPLVVWAVAQQFFFGFPINGVSIFFGWLSEKMPHAVPVYMRPSNKDRLYIALYARGGDSIMSGGEDK